MANGSAKAEGRAGLEILGATYPCASACLRLATDSASSSSSMNSETISEGLATSVRDFVPTTISWTCPRRVSVSVLHGKGRRSRTYILLGPGEIDDSFLDRPSTSHHRQPCLSLDLSNTQDQKECEGDIRNETIHGNLLGLSDSVRPVHGLRVIGRIPIVVV